MIIEDDPNLSMLMAQSIKKYGYEVFCIQDFENVEQKFKELNPHLVILDITLPYFDGLYLYKVFRNSLKIPLLITSARNTKLEQVRGIEVGADDYITKPFSMEYLITKIRAALRRTYGEYSKTYELEKLEVKGVKLDESSFSMCMNGSIIELTKNEFKLLKALIYNPDVIISREVLLEKIWDKSSFVDENTLTVNITRIRKKFASIGFDDIIKIKKGVGYYFDSTKTGASND